MGNDVSLVFDVAYMEKRESVSQSLTNQNADCQRPLDDTLVVWGLIGLMRSLSQCRPH